MYGPLNNPLHIYRLASQLESVEGVRIIVFRRNSFLLKMFVREVDGSISEIPECDWGLHEHEKNWGHVLRWWDMSDADLTAGLLTIRNGDIFAQYQIENDSAKVRFRSGYYFVYDENDKPCGLKSVDMKFGDV